MTVSDIEEARRRRDERRERIKAAADWVFCEIPWASAYRFNADFSRRCAGMDTMELRDLDNELERREKLYLALHEDINVLCHMIPGRIDRYSQAATWLLDDPARRLHDEDFSRKFGDLTRAEIMLTIAERSRLVKLLPR